MSEKIPYCPECRTTLGNSSHAPTCSTTGPVTLDQTVTSEKAAPAKQYLDESVIYVFIRQDVEVKHQIVQALHAMRQSTTNYVMANVATEAYAAETSPEEISSLLETTIVDPPLTRGIPFLTTVGMPDKAGLDRVLEKLAKNSIAHTAFHDTDYQFGVIAVVTEPLPLSVREKPDGLMCNYRLWNQFNNKAEPTLTPNDKNFGFCSQCDDYVFGSGCEHFRVYSLNNPFSAPPPRNWTREELVAAFEANPNMPAIPTENVCLVVDGLLPYLKSIGMPAGGAR